MNRHISNILKGVVGLTFSGLLWGCAAENPFDTEGTGTVRLRTVVNSITSRAIDDTEEAALRANCVVYISENGKGLVYKEKGLDNVKEAISLKAGGYIAEAWSGDSLSASFTGKYYKAYVPFDVTRGSTSNVVLDCKIQNVVASINTSTINPNLMRDDYKITIGNTRGELVFTKAEGDGRGYFMMPNGETDLSYTVSGTRKDGKPFTQSGKITGVERGHHYIINIKYSPEDQVDPEEGGAWIKIEIEDENLIDGGNVLVKSRPTITGVGFNAEDQLKCIEDSDIPENISLQICGFDGIDDVVFSPAASWSMLIGDAAEGKLSGLQQVNFTKASDAILNLLKANGIDFSKPEPNKDGTVETAFLTLSKEVISRLPARDTEYAFGLSVTDDGSRVTEATLAIARSANAIRVADPIEVSPIDPADYMSVLATSATLSYKLSDTVEGTPGVEYTKKGANDWIFAPATSVSSAKRRQTRSGASTPSITLTGLEAGTTYQYRAKCGEFTGSKIYEFTTESIFTIPNSGMEDWSNWSENSKVLLPAAGGERTFWDSGNHGSATMSVTLTQGSEDMFHSPSKSARLKSQFVGVAGLGKFAAGNLFVGTYLRTDGTDGVLEFGRPYNGSHPTALRVWVNYRPGEVQKKGANASYLKEGDIDEGQIYVALSTMPVEVRTKTSNQKLFDKDSVEILAYGQHTFAKTGYGPDGALQELIIPIEYYDRARTNAATHLVIVCSASKYGDYFCGGEGSTMYIDDFELIY